MKILKVIHGYPPYYMAGSEVYTYNLVRKLSEKHEISVFTRIENDFEGPYRYSDSVENNVKIRRVNIPLRDYSLYQKYINRDVDKLFEEYLLEEKPDIVHIGHLSHLSTNIIKIAKKHNMPVIYTIHDFWLFCFGGQLMTPDVKPCPGRNSENCFNCLNKKFRGSEKKESLEQYFSHMKETVDLIDLFIAPSLHVKEWFEKNGIPADRIVHERYGFEKYRIKRKTNSFRENKVPVFGYTGRVIPVKGTDKLISIFSSPELKDAELKIFGNTGSAELFLGNNTASNIAFNGPYHNNEISEILEEIDVLIAPSMWYEVSPLVIQEAQIAGVPVITTDYGGMAELVDDRINGFKFPLNDWDCLKSLIIRIKDDPSLLNSLEYAGDSVVDISEHADKLTSIYREAIKSADKQ